MKKRVVVIVSAGIIAAVSIGGYAFAQGANEKRINDVQERVRIEGTTYRGNNNHCGNSEEMIEIMKENGFEDMAQWMENGDFKSMDEFMNNLSDEDYEKMITLTRDNGYGNMSRMMESIGREGMINMHNSMMDSDGSRLNMMKRFQ
ncbi:hypothetical protein CACET_c26010 [Clostridium aceticum]|uniref:Uncharacterized protein n=1 Tax=Clostridium aceticum TaxID=84022 RepID=A0A0D8IAH3_9CLOT|nr:hypothetical protein [Clostridium aceticum]AKL96046.1 hypothetical protein CACET_c26010 [Clostridium aceticum]KJF27022.1 hypothetical protein TZ02_09430 [Clostridium aceticum]